MAGDVVSEVERHSSYTVIRATGYLDVSTSPRRRERILEVAVDEPTLLIIDLGGRVPRLQRPRSDPQRRPRGARLLKPKGVTEVKV